MLGQSCAADGLETDGGSHGEGRSGEASGCTGPPLPLSDRIFSPKPFPGFSELMLHIEQIQKRQPTLLKRARLSLSFLKPFFHSSLLLLAAGGDTRCPHNILGKGKGGVTGLDTLCSRLPRDFPTVTPLFLT